MAGAYTGAMSGENARAELHELVDHLRPGQLRRVLRLVRGEVESTDTTDPKTPVEGRRRALSFAGIVEDEPDAARRSEELLRAEFQPHS